jgi:4-alpha-glucanotransferase
MSNQRFQFKRSSGVLLHPTSLPGPDGIGDLGPSAYRFVDWLEQTGQGLWQILPLGPTSFGDSPYQTLSAFAGNPLLISLDQLSQNGLLGEADLSGRPVFPADRVDFGKVIDWKNRQLDMAWKNFQSLATGQEKTEFDSWRKGQAAWLEDFALFMALKEDHDGQPWHQWPVSLRDRQPDELAAAADRLGNRVSAHAFRQWVFFTQWMRLKAFALARDIRFVGDLPIFVAHDSSDVWAHPEFFLLEEDGQPSCVAGVPPDYFSETGQLWGNPLYDWGRLAADGFQWWVDRVRACLETVDLVRIDHFRGFAAYWEVPADAETAVAGRWVLGPGAAFFDALKKDLGGKLPIIAEDLGVITPDVEKLRDDFQLPGMKILQFAWSGPDNLFQPHNFTPNCVVYSGTHDNDPTLGWWRLLADEATRKQVSEYLGREIIEPHWALIRLGMMSCAHTFIATMQDVLGLGREGRMNLPGEGSGNWNWRMPESAFTDSAGERLARLTYLSFRRGDQVRKHEADPSYEPEPQA